MIINISDVWVKAHAEHASFLHNIFEKYEADNKLSIGPPSKLEIALRKFLGKYRVLINAVIPQDFSVATAEFAHLFNGAEFEQAKTILNFYFDYTAFSEKKRWKERPWSAYKLCRKAGYNFCPYCQINTIDTSVGRKSADRAYRPQLDHILSKSDFPFLALTLANLIPSCEKCNSSTMKGSINFDKIKHLNPFCDAEAITFELVLRKRRKNLDLTIENYQLNLQIDPNLAEKGGNSINTFQINKRYKIFIGEALAVASRARVGSATEEMYRLKFPQLMHRIEDCTGFDPKDASYKNISAGKMKLDIFAKWWN